MNGTVNGKCWSWVHPNVPHLEDKNSDIGMLFVDVSLWNIINHHSKDESVEFSPRVAHLQARSELRSDL